METFEVRCQSCGNMKQVVCDPQDMQKWKDGEYIQDALHYLSPADRELLVSATCGECFDNMFGSSEDEDLEEDDEEYDVFEEDDDEDEYEDDDDELEEDDWSFEDDEEQQDEGLLDLTQAEQNIMAEVCSIISSFLMNAEPTNESYAELGEKISLAADGCSSQFFGLLYDKFHRSGKNRE